MRSIMLALAMIVPSVANAKDNNDKLMQLTVDQFSRKMEIRDDDMQTVAIFSTQRGYTKTRSTGGLLGADSDVWLKAGIDKKTGPSVFFVMATISVSVRFNRS